jgi:hypothetical protein
VATDARLVDVRQIGPDRERDISGKCSSCGVTLITRLDDCEGVTPNRLTEKLENLFARHLSEKHISPSRDQLLPSV